MTYSLVIKNSEQLQTIRDREIIITPILFDLIPLLNFDTKVSNIDSIIALRFHYTNEVNEIFFT